MGRLVKCQYCQQMVDKDVSVRFEDKNFHEKCCQDYKDRKKIYKYVAHLFGFKSENRPGPVIISQLKNFMEKYPYYTYEGILNALTYFYDVKKGSKKKASEGIGIVPYVYDEAQEYYQKLNYKQEKVAETIIKQLDKEPVVIKVKKQREKKEKPLYNLEEL